MTDIECGECWYEYVCTREAGHDGPHNDFYWLYQWPASPSSPSAITPVEPAPSLVAEKGQAKP